MTDSLNDRVPRDARKNDDWDLVFEQADETPRPLTEHERSLLRELLQNSVVH